MRGHDLPRQEQIRRTVRFERKHEGRRTAVAANLFSSFEGWTKDYIARDILAGLTLAAITIPEQMATAKLGGL